MPWPSRSLGSHSRSPGQSAALRHTTGSGQRFTQAERFWDRPEASRYNVRAPAFMVLGPWLTSPIPEPAISRSGWLARRPIPVYAVR